jgi:hypothetical protein
MGWQGDGGRDGFLWGRVLLTAEGRQAVGGAQRPAVSFQGADAGDEQLADGLHEAGTLAGWRDAVRAAEPFPKVRLAVCASLAPPLLSVLDAHNFVVDFSGVTSQGKTTTLRVAAGCWGCPDERSPSAALSTWDSTRVWIERASAVLNGLPLVLDDTKRCRRPEDVAQTLYDVASGRGRGRGSPKGMQRAGTWATVLLSSGEAAVTSFTQDGGTHARALKLWGPPFGQADAATAPVVQALDQGVRQHYGHAGPLFVEYLLRKRERWPAWQRSFRRLQEAYARKAAGDPVAGRLAAHFAALTVCARLARRALRLPWKWGNPVKELWEELRSQAAEADKAAAALRDVLSWACGHQKDFCGSGTSEERQPPGGWAGKWEAGEKHGEAPKFVAFFPHRLKEVLAGAGHEYEPTVQTWKDRGWLLTDRSSGKARHRCRVGEANAWLIAVGRAAIEEVEGREPDPAPTARERALLREDERMLDEAITMSGIGPQVLDWAASQGGNGRGTEGEHATR